VFKNEEHQIASTLLVEMTYAAITKTSLGKWPCYLQAQVSWHGEVNAILFNIIFAFLGTLIKTMLFLYSTMTTNTAKFSYHITMRNSSLRRVQNPFRAATPQHALYSYLTTWHVIRFCSHPTQTLNQAKNASIHSFQYIIHYSFYNLLHNASNCQVLLNKSRIH